MRRSKIKHPLAILRRELDKTPLGFQIATQKGLAEVLDVSRETISQIERGVLKLSPKLASKVESITGISAAWLLGGDTTAIPIDVDGNRYDAEKRFSIPKYKLVSMSEERAKLLGGKVERVMMEFIKDQEKFSILFHKINAAIDEVKGS